MALYEIETNAHIMIGWADSQEQASLIANCQSLIAHAVRA